MNIKMKTCKDCGTRYSNKGSYNLFITTGIKQNGKPKKTRFKHIPLCEACYSRYDSTEGVSIQWTKKG